jgi:NhaP-type Na+/H+ or K+/H+ antiporter
MTGEPFGDSAMPIRRRVGYAIGGALPVLVAHFALYSNYGTHTMYFRGRAYVDQVLSFHHTWTQLAFILLSVGFYLLASAIRGERLFSRKWPLSAVAAVTLAWVLICGMVVVRGFIAPEPPMPQCITTWW